MIILFFNTKKWQIIYSLYLYSDLHQMCAHKKLNSARIYKLDISSDFPAKPMIVSDNKDSEISEDI